MTNAEETLQRLRSLKPRFGELRLKRVRVFGSVARNEAEPDSDIDLLVDFDDGVTLFDVMDAQEALEHELGRKVDIVTPEALHEALKDKILSEARDV